jgi:hypothetical protein
MVEVRSLGGASHVLGSARGAFVNILTWASNPAEFRQKAELIVRHLGGMFVADIVDPEPVKARRARSGGGFVEEIEEMISRARGNPNAIIYGTFHTFDQDNA